MPLIKHLSSLISMSPRLEQEIRSRTQTLVFTKGDSLLGAGERCNNLYFIHKGLLRGYYFREGKEVTNWFAQEGEFATCFYAFIANKPSFENIQALENVELLALSNSALQELYQRFPETERIGRLVTETYYIRLEERLLGLQFKTARERYENLVAAKPLLLQRASLGQIASYLGITQETLSRIRAGH